MCRLQLRTSGSAKEATQRYLASSLISLREVGAGRSAVFTSDCSPHWAPPEFCEQWAGYRAVFDGLVTWLAA